jgi:tRNA (guanine37-N1)-methyltransferase
MRIDVVTIFPELLSGPLATSIMGRAVEAGLVEFGVHDLRDHGLGRHRSVDDQPYGGGAGMVMRPEPLFAAVEPLRDAGSHVILMDPAGDRFTDALARQLARLPRIALVCGRYEGIDERARALVDRELSIGDYVLTGGELPALVVLDATARLVPGVVGDEESVARDSFARGILDFPQFTRPAVFRGFEVPAVLLSGHHGAIAAWRRREALARTLERRPDLLETAGLDSDDRAVLNELRKRDE